VPEGDTIFRTARALHRALAGQEVTRFETVLPQLARVDDDAPIVGRTVDRVVSRGKHVLIYFSGDLVLRTHMRMNGSWHIYRPGGRWRMPRRDMRVVVGTREYEAVAFRVPIAEFRTEAALARDPDIQRLGPDLLDPDFDVEEAIRRLRASAWQSIADALLDQRVVAGIGNVFKSEALFVAGVSPLLAPHTLDEDRLRRLLQIARIQMAANTHDALTPGVVSRFSGRRTTGRLNPASGLWVYGRAGERCRKCGTAIVLLHQGDHARLTYYCPTCQR
jgi:endonuclease VIII